MLYMGSTGDGIPVENSVAAWTYGELNENFITERDIVITFEFAMFSETGQQSYKEPTGLNSSPNIGGEGISIIFFSGLKNDNLKLYSGSTSAGDRINSNNNIYENGGIGTAFGYLSSSPELSGLDTGHACVALDIRGQFADTTVANSITVRGPVTAGSATQVDTTVATDSLYQGVVDDMDDLQFTKCRVTLTDLGRRIIVETAPSGTTAFTEHINARMEDTWPDGYDLPSRLKPAVSFCTSDYITNCVFRSVEITGEGNVRLDALPQYV